MSTSTIVQDSQPLEVADRCDRCGAQAYVRVGLMNGELLFCGHHFAKQQAALVSAAISIRDQREDLRVKPGASA
jgi:hypothetical protein